MLPAQHDFTVMRGTSGPTQGLVFQLKAKDTNGDLVNIPFTDVRLSIYKRKTLLLRPTIDNGGLVVTDVDENEIRWIPLPEETRTIPIGAKATYELEVWHAGTQIVYLYGTITGKGGVNDDEEVS